MFARATSGDKRNNNKFSPCSLRSINAVLNTKAKSLKGCFQGEYRSESIFLFFSLCSQVNFFLFLVFLFVIQFEKTREKKLKKLLTKLVYVCCYHKKRY